MARPISFPTVKPARIVLILAFGLTVLLITTAMQASAYGQYTKKYSGNGSNPNMGGHHQGHRSGMGMNSMPHTQQSFGGYQRNLSSNRSTIPFHNQPKPQSYVNRMNSGMHLNHSHSNATNFKKSTPQSYVNRVSPRDFGTPKTYVNRVSPRDLTPKTYVNRVTPRDLGQKTYVNKVSPRDFGPQTYVNRVTQRDLTPKTYVNRVSPQDLNRSKTYVNRVSPRDLAGNTYVNRVSSRDLAAAGMMDHSHHHHAHHHHHGHHESYWWHHHHTPSWVNYSNNGWAWPYWTWTSAYSLPLFGHCYTDPTYVGTSEPIVTVVDGGAPAVAEEPIEAVADDGSVDIELAGLQLLTPGDMKENGPLYRVAIRNNSSAAIGAFDVALMATNGGDPDAKTPFAVERVDGIDGDETVTIEVRMPVKANQMNRTSEGKPAPFTTLFVGVDPRGEISEASKDNNVVRVARKDVPRLAVASTK
jgi:hypothetical protein